LELLEELVTAITINLAEYSQAVEVEIKKFRYLKNRFVR